MGEVVIDTPWLLVDLRFDSHEGGKVKPLEIAFNGGEANFSQERFVFLDGKGYQHILQCFAFPGNF
jgi:hypothetical protein